MDAPQEPRWLDPEEQQAWRALARTLVRLPAALDAQLHRDAGISHFEYQVLALLSEAPGRTLRMSTLATQAGARCRGCPRSSHGWSSAAGCAAPPTQPTAATPWRP